MFRASNLRSTVVSLWFRLISLGIVGLVFAEALMLAPGKAQGWTFYLTPSEVVFEIVLRLVFAALGGIVLGTLCTAALAPFLWRFKSSRELLAARATQVAVVLVVFLDSRFALITLIKWGNRGLRFLPALLIAYLVAFAAAFFIRRTRKELLTSMDGFLGEKFTRRAAIATVAGSAALVVTEYAFSKRVPGVKAALASRRPKSNFLLITFDALDAEDMSLYGYGLPTTPNIDAFARKATVFTNFYSASTFTTPSIAAMQTGMYPSQSHVYQLQGRISKADTGEDLTARDARCRLYYWRLSQQSVRILSCERGGERVRLSAGANLPRGRSTGFVERNQPSAPAFRFWKPHRRILRS